METSHLIWTEESRREEYRTGVMSVYAKDCISPEGKKRNFTFIDCPDWVNVIPVINTPSGRQFVLVRQWRHGSQEISVEFPGGILESGEDPEIGARRELEEETAYRAGRLVKLGAVRPNPAIMTNMVHFYLAEDLIPLAGQNLDEDEFLDVEIIGEKELLENMGKPPYVHSLSAAALAFFLLRKA